VPGIYTDAQNVNAGILVSGPAAIGSGGEAQWSIAAAPGLGCDNPQPATFYTGPALASANSALAARIKTAGITATQYAFGLVGQNSCANDGNWYGNAIIGVTMVGKQLTVSSFTHGSVDASSPYETVIYNKQ
jgi:hypothetical protein